VAKSQPTYNNKDSCKKSLKRDTSPYPGWWIFVGIPWRKKKTWIEQFRKFEYENDIS
tara:strand:+ start:2126 stop:2296 length:171 start_codon:yes stop_codon:yes gene_type:complete